MLIARRVEEKLRNRVPSASITSVAVRWRRGELELPSLNKVPCARSGKQRRKTVRDLIGSRRHGQ